MLYNFFFVVKEYVALEVTSVLDVVLVLVLHQMVEVMNIYKPINYSRK